MFILVFYVYWDGEMRIFAKVIEKDALYFLKIEYANWINVAEYILT